MGIAHHIKEIGRGQAGARSLDIGAARDLMSQVLDGTVTDLEVGAFALAMRVKGESLDELVGFSDALQARLTPVPSRQPVIIIPSYNGARRLPNLTPLLAMRLAQEGRQGAGARPAARSHAGDQLRDLPGPRPAAGRQCQRCDRAVAAQRAGLHAHRRAVPRRCRNCWTCAGWSACATAATPSPS